MTETVSAQQTSSFETGTKGRSHELLWLLALMAVMLAANLATLEKTPAVWCDEVMYADPAVNLCQGHGFTSGAWYVQGSGQFWAGNVPLYPFVLCAWLKFFGFSLAGVRSFHPVFMGLAISLLWLAIRRLNLIASPLYRLAFCALLCCCTSLAFVYRNARPESVCVLLLALVLLAWSIPHRPLRLLLMFALGISWVWSGLQMAAYAAIMAGLLWLWDQRRFRAEPIVLGLGCAVGMALLFAFYSHQGVWKEFLLSIRQHTIATQHLEVGLGYGTFSAKLKRLPGIYGDYSSLPILLLAWLLALAKLISGTLHWRTLLVFGLLAWLVVPLGFFIIGVFPIYYCWMSFMPLALGVCATLGAEESLARARSQFRVAVFAVVALASLVGLPRRLLAAATEWQARSYDPVIRLAAPYVASDRVVYCDFAAYYAAKQESATVLLPTHLPALTEEEKNNVSVAIVHFSGDGDLAWLGREFGGVWQDTGASLEPKISTSFPGLHEGLGAQEYRLKVFTRLAARK